MKLLVILAVLVISTFGYRYDQDRESGFNREKIENFANEVKDVVKTARRGCGELICSSDSLITYSECCGLPPSINCCTKVKPEAWMVGGVIVAFVLLCACCCCLCRCCCKKQAVQAPSIVINTIRSHTTDDGPPYQIMNA